MKIALDAMGGDNAPEETVKGAVLACSKYSDLKIILVGKEDQLKKELQLHDFPESKIEVFPVSQVVEMDDSPTSVLRKKKDSSIIKGLKLVKENKADGFVSAGNTGAVMAGSLFNLGRIKGIKRPSIATIFPSNKGNTLVIDAGANVDSKPENLLQFGIMGQIYIEHIYKINKPRLGLLSIGEEEKKGNQLTAGTYQLLKKDDRIKNFIGNVEGRDIFNGKCDIIVCDGFVGNVVLKTTEGVASYMFKLLKEVLTKNFLTKIGALLLKSQLKKIMDKVDYRQYGGAPLLGVEGMVIISHGSSDATAIMNALKIARETVKLDVVGLIEKEINKDGEANA